MAEIFASPEARLFYLLALNALVLWSAWRMASRVNADRFDAISDAGLLFYLVQYVSVCAVGVIGCLGPLTIGAVAVVLSGAMLLISARRAVAATPVSRSTRSGDDSAGLAAMPRRDAGVATTSESRAALIIFGASAAFVLGYAGCLIVYQNALPVISNDAITYHLPAAVQWLQTGRIGLYEAWFYNPANSYSPLAGSVFIEWLLAPLRNDTFARFVQAGPLLLLFFGVVNLCRRVGADVGVAGLIAVGAVLARPIVSQTALAKDDLFVAAFFVLALDAMRRERMERRLGPWRAGIAMGLMLATKFTVLLSLPLLYLVLGRGRKWQWAIINFLCAMVLAGPWYVRNALLTGNLFYPTRIAIGGATLLPGMIDVHRSALLTTASGVWHVFTNGYYGVPVALAIVLIAGWCGGIFAAGKNAWRDRVMRASIVGAAIGIAIFVALAPYGEMRFAYPSLMLLFVATCVAIVRLPRVVQMLIGAAIAILAAATAFKVAAGDFLIAGAVSAVIGAGIVAALLRWPVAKRFMPAAVGLICIGGMMFAYVNWKRYVIQSEANSTDAWADPGTYGAVGEVWRYAREAIPKGETIAYANTYFTYPLMGYSYDHRVVYAPTRAGLDRFVDMPAIDGKITGEEIVAHIVTMLHENPDRAQWLTRLKATKAEYLVVGKTLAEMKTKSPPPEIRFAAELPQTFGKVFENEAGVIYYIH